MVIRDICIPKVLDDAITEVGLANNVGEDELIAQYIQDGIARANAASQPVKPPKPQTVLRSESGWMD